VRAFGLIEGKRILLSENTYVAGKQHGRSLVYLPTTGRVCIRGNFETGLRHGSFLVFYPDGTMALQMHHVQGLVDGLSEVFGEQGDPIAIGTHENGTPKSGQFLEDLPAFIQEAARWRPRDRESHRDEREGRIGIKRRENHSPKALSARSRECRS
jgi:hypothetical protein